MEEAHKHRHNQQRQFHQHTHLLSDTHNLICRFRVTEGHSISCSLAFYPPLPCGIINWLILRKYTLCAALFSQKASPSSGSAPLSSSLPFLAMPDILEAHVVFFLPPSILHSFSRPVRNLAPFLISGFLFSILQSSFFQAYR